MYSLLLDFDNAMPRNTWVEFLNLEENQMFDKVQKKDNKARQVLSNSVIHMKAIYTFSNLCEIEAFVKREEEAARIMNDRMNPMQIMKYMERKMNLAENFDPDYGPIPIPEIINGRKYSTVSLTCKSSNFFELTSTLHRDRRLVGCTDFKSHDLVRKFFIFIFECLKYGPCPAVRVFYSFPFF